MKTKRFLVLSNLILIGIIIFMLNSMTGIGRSIALSLPYVHWNFREIVDYIDAPYPEDATDIRHDSDQWGRTFFIELEFKAPPDQALAFVESICDGILYRGFDPFNSSRRINNEQKPYLVLVHIDATFSYSVNSNEEILGNRCRPPNNKEKYGKRQYISVDISNPNLYVVRYEMPQSQNISKYSPEMFPSPDIELAEYVNPIPALPFMVVGLRKMYDGSYHLATDQICFESILNYDAGLKQYRTNGDVVGKIVGKNVKIYINNLIVADASISASGILLDENHPYFNYPPRVIRDLWYQQYFNYCYYQEIWHAGTYHMRLDVDGESYAWDFIVEE